MPAQAQSPEDIFGDILSAYDDPEPDEQDGDAGLGNGGQPEHEQLDAVQHIPGQHVADPALGGNAGAAQHALGQHVVDPALGGNAGAGLPMGANDAAPNVEPVAPGGGTPAAATPTAAQNRFPPQPQRVVGIETDARRGRDARDDSAAVSNTPQQKLFYAMLTVCFPVHTVVTAQQEMQHINIQPQPQMNCHT